MNTNERAARVLELEAKRRRAAKFSCSDRAETAELADHAVTLAKENEQLRECLGPANVWDVLIEVAQMLGKWEAMSEHSLPYEVKQLKVKIDLAVIDNAAQITKAKQRKELRATLTEQDE